MRTIAILPVLMFATAASAADFPRRPVYQAPMIQAAPWTGFYVGGNIGGGWANAPADFSTTATGPIFGTANNHMAGFAGGAQLGYNWQTGPYLLGAETDFQFANIDGSLSTSCPVAVCGVTLSASYQQKVPWFGTVRARFGYAQDGWLLYVTGGYAYAQLETNASATVVSTTTLSHKDFRNGWTAGGGIEVALSPRWSVKAEYLYLDLGTSSTTWAVTGLPTLTDHSKLNMNVVRTGVNYRF